MKTTIGLITAVAMYFTAVGCGAAQSDNRAKPANQTVQPDQADRSPTLQPHGQEQGTGPRCRDPEVCPR